MLASRWRVAAIAAGVALVVALWGGYGQHWAWTGFTGRAATLWDWLHLLLLPIVVGLLPIWLSRETRLSPRYKFWALIALAVFGALVLAGYLVPWIWTGFTGNRLWDWLELLALPVALALTPLLDEMRQGWTTRHSVVALVALATFVAVVIAGYVWNWGWTGFRGNTLWNWLQLLLLPLLVPTVIVPALKPRAMATVTRVEQDHQTAAAARPRGNREQSASRARGGPRRDVPGLRGDLPGPFLTDGPPCPRLGLTALAQVRAAAADDNLAHRTAAPGTRLALRAGAPESDPGRSRGRRRRGESRRSTRPWLRSPPPAPPRSRLAGAPTGVRSKRPAARSGWIPAREQRLVGIDVADAGDPPLVEEE